MRGTHELLALTTKTITAEQDPTLEDGEVRVEPLFSFPIQVCNAVKSPKSSVERLAPSGTKRQQVYRDPATGEDVADDECGHGVKVGPDYKPIPSEAWTAIGERTKIKMMVALERLPLDEARARYAERFAKFYYLQAPEGAGAAKAYRLTFESLREQRKGKKVVAPAQAIVTKRTVTTRQELCIVYADEDRGCLAMYGLTFAALLHQPDEAVTAPMHAEVSEAMIAKARQMVEQAIPTGLRVLDTETDDAVALREDLVARALDGETIDAPTPLAQTTADDNLEALLEASIG